MITFPKTFADFIFFLSGISKMYSELLLGLIVFVIAPGTAKGLPLFS